MMASLDSLCASFNKAAQHVRTHDVAGARPDAQYPFKGTVVQRMRYCGIFVLSTFCDSRTMWPY